MVGACGRVRVEEAIEACADDGDALAVENAEAESVAVPTAGGADGGVVWVVDCAVGWIGAALCVGVGLVVSVHGSDWYNNLFIFGGEWG